MKKLLLALLTMAGAVWATETEHLGIRVLPTPGKVKVDGKFDDWDLSGGIFVCGDVENARDKFAVWFHLMYDAENLYVLARWADETPLNNPGSTKGDYGFAGDCLQFRTVTAVETPKERGQHFTAWRDHDGIDVIKVEQGTKFNEGDIKDVKPQGAQQAFATNADGKGYIQEMAIPWKLLTRDGQPLHAGDKFTITVEPNFTIGVNGRASIKDIFKPGITPDRVFTFMSYPSWGPATLESKGNVTPQPLRLADVREFPVKMEKGVPVVNWTGLIKSKDLAGFKPIKFTMTEDGYISLNIKNADGIVVRQLLNTTFMTKGPHEVKWDGLTTPNWKKPGDPVPPGEYTWSALVHPGINLRLRGWACNGGATPWDFPTTGNWGGDHGVPATAAVDDEKVYLGWSAAEAGKALLACDLQGNVKWNNTHGGIAGAAMVAVDAGTVFVVRETESDPSKKVTLYRLDTKTGGYTVWGTGDSADLLIASPDGLDAKNGKIYLSYAKQNEIKVLDSKTGQEQKVLKITAPGFIKVLSDTSAFVISAGTSVVALNPSTGETKPIVSGLQSATAVAVDKEGKLYVGVRDPDNQVKIFSADGKPVGSIGRPGGRSLFGAWQADGMHFISGMTIDAEGKLWVMEADDSPKRVSVWDTKSGKLVKEFFGPTSYGAGGGAIDPLDPDVMVGHGCEWRLDPKTGRAACVGVFTRNGMANARFAIGANGKLYLAVASSWAFEIGPVSIYERVGDADYKLRALFTYEGKEKDKKTIYWADENGDGQRQPNEVTTVDGHVRFSGWYMALAPDLTVYAGTQQFKPTGFTACGAPKYDLAHPVQMPKPTGNPTGNSVGSPDGKLVFYAGDYGENMTWNECYDIASGKRLWTYPDNFVGVHGSHNAIPAQVGMIRGSFGACGTAKFPAPIGSVWVIPTNVGEWHILTEDGFYLAKLFQGDQMKIQWPEAVPGASLDNCPPGMGGEDFGGSISQTKDGRLFVEAGKTAYWNIEVVGLDKVKALKGDHVRITDADVVQARKFHDEFAQASVGTRRATVKKMTPTFSGNIENDFKGAEIISYKKQDDAAVRSVVAWDDQNLYLAWDVRDRTPWVNGATDATMMYIGGDTVDFQLGTDPKADKNRNEAALGDLRLSIGNFQSSPTAVIYRKSAKEKNPKTFSSGIVKEYKMDSVVVLKDARITITKRGDGYVVEAIIPLSALDIRPADGLALRGDFGATHADPAGQRTRLRTYWNNQHTGIVDDAVFELQMEPKNWGEIIFAP